MTDQPGNQRRIGLALAAVAVCLYAPFGWVVLIDYPWNSYRLLWVKLWPVLPGIVPGAWLFHGRDAVEFVTMGLFTLALLAGLTWLGSRGGYRLLAAALIALLVSIPSAVLAYRAFLV